MIPTLHNSMQTVVLPKSVTPYRIIENIQSKSSKNDPPTFSLLNFVFLIQSLDFPSMRSTNWRLRPRLTHRNAGATRARDGVWISLIEARLEPTSTKGLFF